MSSGLPSLSAIASMLRRVQIPIADVPSLRRIFEGATEEVNTRVRRFAAIDAQFRLESVKRVTGREVSSDRRSMLMASQAVAEWRQPALYGLSRALLGLCLDMMYGATLHGTHPDPMAEPSDLESSVSVHMATIFGDAIREALAQVAPLTFGSVMSIRGKRSDDRLDNDADFLMVSWSHANAPLQVVATIPLSEIEAFRDQLEGLADDAPVVAAPWWNEGLRHVLGDVSVETQTLIKARPLSLIELMQLRPGATIELDGAAFRQATTLAEGVEIACGKIGKLGDKYCLQVESLL